MTTDLCFAYGTTTDTVDRGGRNSVDPDGISRLGTALLPDRCLAFDSAPVRRGGVLNVRARIGGYVQGVLLRAGRDALDSKEGAHGSYRRVSRTVILPSGAAVAAIVHELAETDPGTFVPPSDKYVDAVRRFLASHFIDAAPLVAAARDGEGGHVLADVFAYGTLMRGEALHPPAVRTGLVSVTPARTSGRLHDFGAYPGMALESADTGRPVQGELLTFADPAVALPMLDRIEEARPGCAPGGPYRRTIVTVTDVSGRARLAWAYVVERTRVASAPIIASGSWASGSLRRPA